MIRNFIRESIVSVFVEAKLGVSDLFDTVLRRRPPMVPPRRMMYDGPRDPHIFCANSEEFLRYYIDICHLAPDERILDIGSGLGRKTIPLTNYLNQKGSYLGLEINPVGVEWCQNAISTRYPNFQFQQIDVFNGCYHLAGQYRAADYTFPFADELFDFIVLISVFTHMFPDGISRYLSEIKRLLDFKRGRCLISFFLLNEEAEMHIQYSESVLKFSNRLDHHAIERTDCPESAVAYNETFIRDLYSMNHLEITDVFYGSWCGRSDFLSFQDLIVARAV